MKKLVGFIAAIAILASMASHEAMAHDLTHKEKATIEKEIKRGLSDPESARFQWLKLPKSVGIRPPDTATTYCGLVNAKNKMGGYVGYKPFLAIFLTVGYGIDPMMRVLIGHADEDGYDNTPLILEKCVKAGYTEFSSAE